MLKSLDVFGFKSFADRTKFEFSPGITAVVGPNGSGKSNVVDSIKWILGDQSAKSLRGKDMMDVVFNGSAARKESPYAEAILTFDNATGFLPVDLPEVSIGRRLWRSGDAEYLVNNAPARLKDIRNLFLGTGAGTSAYAIIEQGRVDQILQANASSRRSVFEEAAGISRYKTRRTEAERKLERVDQNLVRLTDIVEELESRLRTLRNQAKKASRYQEVSTQLRRWWLGLVADDCREIASVISVHQSDAESAGERLAHAEAAVAAMAGQLEQADAEVTAAEASLYLIEREAAKNREAIAEHRAAIRYQLSSQDVIDRELESIRSQQTNMQAFHQEGVTERNDLRKKLRDHEAERDETRSRLTHREEQHSETVAAIDLLSAQLTDARRIQSEEEQQAGELRSRIDSVNVKRETLADRHAQIEQRQNELNQEEIQLRTLAAETEADLVKAQGAFEEAEANREQITSNLQLISEEQESDRRTLGEWRELRSGCHAKIGILEDLDQKEIGLGLGAKEILRRASESEWPPWNRIHGCVGDLLESDGEYAALVNVALGPLADYLVIQEYASLLEYLSSGTARFDGQVGFVSVMESGPVQVTTRTRESIPLHNPDNVPFELSNPVPIPQADDDLDLAAESGVIARADQLVTGPAFWSELPAVLLGRVWVVDQLETAIRLADSHGKNCRFVTLQGEVWEGGRLQVGLARSDENMIGRRSEVRSLQRELSDLDREIERLQHTIAERQQRIENVRAEYATADELCQQTMSHVSHARQRHNEHVQNLSRLAGDVERIENQKATLNQEQSGYGSEIDAAKRDRNALAETIEHRAQEMIGQERELSVRMDELQRAEAEVHELKLQLVQQEERCEAISASWERLKTELRQRADQQSDAEERWESIQIRQRTLTLQRLNTANELAECMVTNDDFDEQIRSARGVVSDRKEARALLGKEESALRKATREQEEVIHRAELTIRELTQRQESHAERIGEEFQLTLDDVVNSGASAFEEYIRDLKAAREAEPGEAVDSDTDSEALNSAPGDIPPIDAPEDRTPLDELSADELFTDGIEDLDRDAVRAEIEEKVAALRRQARNIGGVNTESLADLDDLEKRFTKLNSQLQDLVQAKKTLEEIIRKINSECKRRFAESFETIRGYFQELFRKLFGGGDGDVILEDSEDILDCGIEIVARPPGKELRSMSLLSGGEKTLTAVALLLAIFKSKPSPFCILDEVDAALDDANITRFVGVLKEFVSTTQFVMITHRKPSMTVADVLYGVTMEEAGISKKMSVRFDQVDDQGNFKNDKQAA